MGIRIDFDDLNHLTVREIITIEAMTGESIMDVLSGGQMMGKVLAGVAFVLARRQDPNITEEEALDVEISLDDVTGARPTTPAG